MSEHALMTLERLFHLLPDLEEVEELRLSFVGASVLDPETQWDSSRAYATIDKRVVSPERIEEVISDAEAAVHQHVARLFSGVRPLLRTLWDGNESEAACHLIELGERQEQSGRYRKARQCFQTALAVSLPLADKSAQILALRRIGRVALALGDLQEALNHYQRSGDLARDAQDLRGQVIAQTGRGNVLAVQGRWDEAEECYRGALHRAAESDEAEAYRIERAQLYNNLGMVSTRQGRAEQAESWFQKALAIWSEASSSADLAICLHNQALLRERQGGREEARRILDQALDLPIPLALRATIEIDLAESYLADGKISQAVRLGREAEEHAIAARSPYYLAHMYRGLGNIARADGGEDGFIFFEKALQIAREKDYRLVEGETLIDYARLRAQMGEGDEAQAYLETAREIFRELGALHEQARAEAGLRGLVESGSR
jgi:tetratricopeptide (TPR) repeat protein